MFKIALYRKTKLVGYLGKNNEKGDHQVFRSGRAAINKLSMLKRVYSLPKDYEFKIERM